MDFWRILCVWCGALLVTTVAIVACIRWIDYPVAIMFLNASKHVGPIGEIFGGRVLVAGELLLISVLAIFRIRNGNLPDLAKTCLLACTTSVLTYTLNYVVLKFVFGRQNPTAFYQSHIAGTFHLFRGDDGSSFPSSHMMLAAAFLGVFIRLYPRARAASLFLILVAAVAMVAGDWHYVSDLIAGSFLGLTAGLMAGELWIRHTARYSIAPGVVVLR
jgi:membrane-associated phospholipid phosphatase